MATNDAWSAAQYQKFRTERLRPFFDLFAMLQPMSHPKARASLAVIDLGCGTGEITSLLAQQLPGASVLGLDSSADMLSQSKQYSDELPNLSFQQGDIAEIDDFSSYELVFSHAAFQWVPDNEGLLGRILSQLKPGAQLAVQLPQNDTHPSHTIAAEVAQEEPFLSWLGGFIRHTHALTLERYSSLLYVHGFVEQVCLEKIYGHVLESTHSVVEWVKGTLLTAYLKRLAPAQQEQFIEAYRQRLIAKLGEQTPYFYPFRRALFWGKKA